MIIHADYYPIVESELPNWHTQFTDQFALLAEELGFSTADVEAAQARAEMVTYVVTRYKPDIEIARLIAFETAAKVLGDGGNLKPESALHPYPLQHETPPVWVFGIERLTRNLVAQIKTQPAYLPEMGHLMGIIGARRHHELSAPHLKLRALMGRRLEVIWTKRGASGLELLVDYGAGFPVEGRLFTPAKFETVLPGEGAQTVMVKGFYVVKNARVGEEGPGFEVTLQG